MNKINSRGQGTIEYLLIIAVVIVISLVVVSLLINQTSTVGAVSSFGNKLGSLSQVIGVTESMVNPNDGNFVVKLLNNSGGVVTISNVKIGDTSVAFGEDLAQGNSKLFKVGTNTVCEQGKIVSDDVVITYVTENGLTKTQRLNDKVMFDCTPFTIVQANLANTCISQAGSLEPNLLPQNISSKVSLFGITGYLGMHSGANLCSNATNNGFVSCSTGGIKANQDAAVDSSRSMFDTNRFSSATLGDGNSVVHDNWYKLMWQNSHVDGKIWNDAMDYCNTLTTGGFSNWRLPTVSEAFSQFDFGAHYNGGSYACVKQFTDCYGSWTWTSTSLPWLASRAYVYLPLYGSVYADNKSSGDSVRCVRSEN
ncbi:MAG: DUF1566 domain-containing protein [Candidatus Diapherotrites archaeon]|nr:DUF1566 domain-containing protein [Candidatus Diapherotrites archaeon]